jgi:hypothetical protein
MIRARGRSAHFAVSMATGAPILSESDYNDIEAAVMETMRGRWFLAEHARRNRHADTQLILAAVERLTAAVRSGNGTAPADATKVDIAEMAMAIALVKADVAALQPRDRGQGQDALEFPGQAEGWVNPEASASDVLTAAEHVQTIASSLREQGVDALICDDLNRRAADIYTAYAFHEVAEQKAQRVFQVLGDLETRINSMIARWGLDEPSDVSSQANGGAAANTTGQPGDLLPADFDFGEWAAQSALVPEPGSDGFGPRNEAARPQPTASVFEVSPISLAQPSTGAGMPAATIATASTKPAVNAHPLAAIAALSNEEKLALFS